MNREIKFRVWENVNYMSSPFSFKHLQVGLIKFTSDCKLMQYTGLKDKNSKEIYEGDILKPCAYIGTNFDEFLCEVIFNNGMFCFKPKEVFITSYKPIGDVLNNGIRANNEFEIVGNIYENPELINNQS